MKNAPTNKNILVISVKGRNMIVKFMILQNVRRVDGKDDDDGVLWYICVAAKGHLDGIRKSIKFEHSMENPLATTNTKIQA